MLYDLVSPFAPAGDQPRAIRELAQGLARQDRYQTLLGVTGSGKTMTMAHVIQEFGRPTLVLSHNKTLAAQLYGELKGFFPTSAVEFFISYYDYYQPEAYVPQTDTYIAKDSSINDDIDRLRLRATSSLMEREDVVIVASVSAIYGLGDPEVYRQRLVTASVGEERGRDALLEALVGSSTSATTRPSSAGRSGCGAIRSKCSQPTTSRPCVSNSGATPWSGSRRSIPSPATRSPSWRGPRCIRPPTSSPSGRPSSAPSRRSVRSSRSASPSCGFKTSCSKPSASSPAPTSTSTCCSRWAAARASRTIRGTSRAARWVSAPHACSTTSPMITSVSSTSRTRRCPSSAGCSKETAPASRRD